MMVLFLTHQILTILFTASYDGSVSNPSNFDIIVFNLFIGDDFFLSFIILFLIYWRVFFPRSNEKLNNKIKLLGDYI